MANGKCELYFLNVDLNSSESCNYFVFFYVIWASPLNSSHVFKINSIALQKIIDIGPAFRTFNIQQELELAAVNIPN